MEQHTSSAHAAAKHICAQVGQKPRVGIILGSGLGAFADEIQHASAFHYDDLPGFVRPTVGGHAGRLVVGELAGQSVACLQGRVHLYEGHPASSVLPMIDTLKRIGCHTLVVTNAAGALNVHAQPGSLMLITDHINFQGQSPLVGPNNDALGPRFPAMDGAYDPGLQATMRAAAAQQGIALSEGVYLAVLGPSFETPAEIAAFGRLGADAVGMSTVPEVIAARYLGLRVAGVSVLTNLGAGLSNVPLSHEQTLTFAHQASEQLRALLRTFLGTLDR